MRCAQGQQARVTEALWICLVAVDAWLDREA
jgi:hypothetical protein